MYEIVYGFDWNGFCRRSNYVSKTHQIQHSFLRTWLFNAISNKLEKHSIGITPDKYVFKFEWNRTYAASFSDAPSKKKKKKTNNNNNRKTTDLSCHKAIKYTTWIFPSHSRVALHYKLAATQFGIRVHSWHPSNLYPIRMACTHLACGYHYA